MSQTTTISGTGLGQLKALIANDSYAITFQSIGQYRSALLQAISAQRTALPRVVAAGGKDGAA